MMSQRNEPPRGPIELFKTSPRFRRWLVRACRVSALYTLSIGPVGWLTAHVLPDFAIPAVRAFYFPIQAILMRSPTLVSVFVAYQDLWVSQAELRQRFYGQ